MLYSTLLTIHIIGGFAALFASFVAIWTKTVGGSHKVHIYSGNTFVIGMTTVFLTTIPMTIIRPNLFLLLIGIFSFYMMFTGWRLAVNRKGTPGWQEKTSSLLMGITSVIMIVIGIISMINGSDFGVILIVFGGLGGFFALGELSRIREGGSTGKDRIRGHLGMMMGATIAAITAFLVTNITTDPAWIAWLAPTAIITPLIIVMSRKYR